MRDDGRDRGASGHGSIMFRQDLAYPREPNLITYYPPEPSEELKKQVMKDKAGGITLYIIGFAVALIAFIMALNFSRDIEIYAMLIPFLLVLGLVFAILYLMLDNVTLATLSRTLPIILLIALILLYIVSILSTVSDLGNIIDGGDQNAIDNALEDIFETILNPAFFMLSAGLLICRAGGTMLWTSTKVVHQYIPGTIILEVPGLASPEQPPEANMHDDADDDEDIEIRLCGNCDEPLTYIKQYDRWYCYECKEYAPRD
ncbi:MAG: hypothetical protein AYK23_02465 [Candidatus Proteinoplasmatales archaeon SG8-5]|nr:MAG: hypothetical protein AYK23_02465 [Candidatus Proteinoplasmatales archaeon SG8-5]